METTDGLLKHNDSAPPEVEATLKASELSEESEENLEAIRKFIEDQDKELQEENNKVNVAKIDELEIESNNITNKDKSTSYDVANKDSNSCTSNETSANENEGTMAVASSVMDMILSESEVKIQDKKDFAPLPKYNSISSADKVASGSISLSVGSRIEAKDFGDEWHPAEIVEVDYDEMEVLVRYEPYNKSISRHDEWISVSSPRLRPTTSSATAKRDTVEDKMPEPVAQVKEEIKEVKVEEKAKLTFTVGERCLARWRDNRRFMATIQNDLGNGTYEIIFDDGFYWKCNVSRLYKWKQTGKNDLLTVDTSLHSPIGVPSPIQVGGPSTAAAPPIPTSFHTHLFDPTRDYLSSKSERREMKRKLNIKEIFNIGQKKQKTKSDKVKKPRIIRRTPKVKSEPVKKELKVELKRDIPDAVASIIGTVKKDEIGIEEIKTEDVIEVKLEEIDKDDLEVTDVTESKDDVQVADDFTMDPFKAELDPVHEEDVKLEKFDEQDSKHEEVIDRMKEVINKLEGGLKEDTLNALKVDNKEETPIPTKLEAIQAKTEEPIENVVVDVVAEANTPVKVKSKKLSKIKKSKKLRMLQEKKVKKQVQKVKSELEEMKKQVEEMRKQMLLKTQEFAKGQSEMPESFLLPGEWCCRWLNGQPVGTVSEIECETKVNGDGKPGLPRRSVQVEDKRLPVGWTKHMVRRSLGHSAGKWDVVLVSPENRRFHTKTDMRNYLENYPDESLKPYEAALMDFGVHLKLARRMGWITTTPGGVADGPTLPRGTLHSTSPLVKRKKLKKSDRKNRRQKKNKLTFRMKLALASQNIVDEIGMETTSDSVATPEPVLDTITLEDGYVYVGSLKVQIIDNLLRCPAEGCFKNFRNNTLLQMHIKHYHRELREKLGDTPKVLDLAYARTMPLDPEPVRQVESKVIKVKIAKPKREEPKVEVTETKPDLLIDIAPKTPVSQDSESIPKVQDSPKLRDALVNKPVKRPKVLLPVRRPEFDPEPMNVDDYEELPETALDKYCVTEPLDFETAISTHTVTKPAGEKRKKDKNLKSLTLMSQKASEDEEWFANSDFETQSSFPRSGTPDSKSMEMQTVKTRALTPESTEELKDSQKYTYTENGERVKIVHMKREEIINCHCGYREEDGLMVQCELCLCWQHALCHNIQSEAQVPEKYTCSICLNPRRGRWSQRFLHDQDRLYEGLLPGARPCDLLRRSHELSGNLLRIQDALHALRVKCFVASKKDHPKLYLWAKDWEHAEISYTQEKLNSDYSDLNIMINTVGKENMPIKPEEMKDMQLGLPSDDADLERFSQRDNQLSSHVLLTSLLSSPGGASLELPISTSELETLAKTVQEQECAVAAAAVGVSGPQPEAAIENGACRVRLLRHLQRCHALVDARLDSIEAQVAELESQDPSFEDDETPDFFPRTKQTVQMLLRDLDTMEELGIIT
ncbi:PHD finger protein 20 isoform X3 [Manduca sexta]|nr:PHD finger protein 20 isoform X3 [Manduca sexta]KAG6447977.1 hypothetical protein O3G_MSEX005267 [Manduca sexta]